MKCAMMGLAAAAGLCLSVGTASADPAGFMTPGTGGGAGLPTWSQIAGPNTLLGAGDAPPGHVPDKYGLHPCLKRFFHVPTANTPGIAGYGANGHNPLTNPANWAAGGYGMGGPAYNPTGFPPPGYAGYQGGGYAGGGAAGCGPAGCGNYQAGPYQPQAYGQMPPMMQGTLAFPYNSLTRSPRDYFMVDVNK